METVQRKLIDLSPGVLRIISRKARSRSMSCKKYIESLVEKDAMTDPDYAADLDDISDSVLLGLVGIAGKHGAEEGQEDDRLEYILSKM